MPIRTRTKARTTRTTKKTAKKATPRRTRTATIGPVLNLIDLVGGPVNGLKVRVFSSNTIPVMGRH